MRELLRLWRRVEGLRVAAGVTEQWKQLLGDDLATLEPYLKPEQQLATSYPCPHPVHDDCPRRVIHRGGNDYVAVCGNASPQCEPLKLGRMDLAVRSLKAKEWLEAITRGLRETNGLEPLDLAAPEGVVTLGTLRRRGRELAVVWIRREVEDVDNLLRGVRATTGTADLIALLPPTQRKAVDRPLTGGGVVLLAAPRGDDGRLDLYRALDLLDPSYRARRATEPTAIFDEIRFEFAEEATRHVVKINGQEYGAFQKSDLKFLRLLLLAAERRADPDVDGGGWLEKFRMQGDNNDHDLEDVRRDLRRLAHPGVTPEDRAALIKPSPERDGRVRLAVPPFNITFDQSLAGFTFLGEQQTEPKAGKARRTEGQQTRADNFARMQKVAKKLLQECRKRGVPAPSQD